MEKLKSREQIALENEYRSMEPAPEMYRKALAENAKLWELVVECKDQLEKCEMFFEQANIKPALPTIRRALSSIAALKKERSV